MTYRVRYRKDGQLMEESPILEDWDQVWRFIDYLSPPFTYEIWRLGSDELVMTGRKQSRGVSCDSSAKTV